MVIRRNIRSRESFGSLPSDDAEVDVGTGQGLDVNLNLKGLSVCLNKEHEGRRLLRLSLSNIGLAMSADESGKSVDASIGGFAANDHSKDVHELNRMVLGRGEGVLGDMVEIKYHRDDGKEPQNRLQYIQLVRELGKPDFGAEDFDSFLFVSVKPIVVNLLVGRTAELADYLSNGLPGKGMGVAGGAAKGFFKEKVRACKR